MYHLHEEKMLAESDNQSKPVRCAKMLSAILTRVSTDTLVRSPPVTNHYMPSHIRDRGTQAEREQNPLRNKWVQHPIFRVRFETARSKPSLSSRNGRSARVRSAYVWTYPRAERECPVSAPQPLRACVSTIRGTSCCVYVIKDVCIWQKSENETV